MDSRGSDVDSNSSFLNSNTKKPANARFIREKMAKEYGKWMDFDLEWIDEGPFHQTKRYLYNGFGVKVLDPFYVGKKDEVKCNVRHDTSSTCESPLHVRSQGPSFEVNKKLDLGKEVKVKNDSEAMFVKKDRNISLAKKADKTDAFINRAIETFIGSISAESKKDNRSVFYNLSINENNDKVDLDTLNSHKEIIQSRSISMANQPTLDTNIHSTNSKEPQITITENDPKIKMKVKELEIAMKRDNSKSEVKNNVLEQQKPTIGSIKDRIAKFNSLLEQSVSMQDKLSQALKKPNIEADKGSFSTTKTALKPLNGFECVNIQEKHKPAGLKENKETTKVDMRPKISLEDFKSKEIKPSEKLCLSNERSQDLSDSQKNETIQSNSKAAKVRFLDQVTEYPIYSRCTFDDFEDEYYPQPEWVTKMYTTYDEFLNSDADFNEIVQNKLKITRSD